MRKLLLCLVVGLMSCKPGISVNTSDPQYIIATARSGIGAKCTSNFDCFEGLTCTTAFGYKEAECALGWDATTQCPDRFESHSTSDCTSGLNCRRPDVSGHWCVPKCDAAADCLNEQCCVGLYSWGGGFCRTFAPGYQYPEGIWCPAK